MKSYPPERSGITLLNAPEGSPEINVSLIRSEGFKFHRVIYNNTWLLHRIEIYINTRSMTFNSLMTLCKHRLDSTPYLCYLCANLLLWNL